MYFLRLGQVSRIHQALKDTQLEVRLACRRAHVGTSVLVVDGQWNIPKRIEKGQGNMIWRTILNHFEPVFLVRRIATVQ